MGNSGAFGGGGQPYITRYWQVGEVGSYTGGPGGVFA